MEHSFWHQRWEEGRIGFHQQEINDWLRRYWPELPLAPGVKVLVPLCGKSLDMLWLREQGHEVLGVELSDIACRDFFLEQGVTVVPVAVDNYHRRERDGITLLTADLFELPWEVFRGIGAVYDRAGLVALPAALRRRYARRLAQRVESGTEMLLVTLEFSAESGPPFAVFEKEVRELFEPAFTVTRLAAEVPANARHEDEREVVYRLHRQ